MKVARIARHLLADRGSVTRLLSKNDLAAIHVAINASEKRHDGEIRFCVEAGLPWSYLKRDASARERAVMLFSKLRVWDTERNTGVLVYLLVADKTIEIVADRGIARVVPQGTWNAICTRMALALRGGRGVAGVVAAIAEIGGELARHFPRRDDDRNELPDAPLVL